MVFQSIHMCYAGQRHLFYPTLQPLQGEEYSMKTFNHKGEMRRIKADSLKKVGYYFLSKGHHLMERFSVYYERVIERQVLL